MENEFKSFQDQLKYQVIKSLKQKKRSPSVIGLKLKLSKLLAPSVLQSSKHSSSTQSSQPLITTSKSVTLTKASISPNNLSTSFSRHINYNNITVGSILKSIFANTNTNTNTNTKTSTIQTDETQMPIAPARKKISPNLVLDGRSAFLHNF